MASANDQQSTAQTDTSLVAALGAGKQIGVTAIFISTDTAQTVTLESGNSTRKWEQYCAANGGALVAVSNPAKEDLFRCVVNEGLTYTYSEAVELVGSGC